LNHRPDNFLDLLEASRLVPPDVVASFRNNGTVNPGQTGAALVDQKLLSPWQLKVLESGLSGPFFLASYLLLDQITSGPLSGCFAARHVPSGHLVILEFESATNQPVAASLSLDQILQKATMVSRIRNPNFLEVFEAISLPDYAFVASELPSGKPLAQLLTEGKKSGSQQTARLIAQIASAVQAIHDAGTIHGNIDLNNIWLTGKDTASLRVPFWPALDPGNIPGTLRTGPALDNFQLACVTVRMWTGKEIDLIPGSTPASEQAEMLLGEKVPELIRKTIGQMLGDDSADCPPAGELSQILARASGIEGMEMTPPAESLVKIRETIQRFHGSTPTTAIVEPVVVDTAIAVTGGKTEFPQLSSTTSGSVARRNKPGKKQWPKWGAAVVAFGLLALGVMYFQPNNDQAVSQIGNESSAANPADPADAFPGSGDPQIDTGNSGNGAVDPDAVIAQTVVADDGKMLWESPTTGPKLDLHWLPPAPRMVFSFRMARLFSSEEGQRLIRASGAGVESAIADLTERTGLDPSEIVELLVGLYIDEDPLKYRSVVVAHLKQPAVPEKLIEALSLQPAGDDDTKTEFGQHFRRNGQDVFAVIDPDGEAGTVPTLVFGPADLIAESVAAGGLPALDGPLARLALMADDERSINALFLPAALFNDAGQAMVGKTWGAITSRLRTEFDETLRAGLLSLNVDGDCYLELMLDHSVDLRPEKALEKLDGQLAMFKTELVHKIAATPSNPWWELVRLQMDNMIHEWYRNLRTGIENEVVVANCWLPATAPHNLIASSEIALGFASGIPSSAIADKPALTIASLDQLLAIPRDLEVTTNPDLGLLLQGIETEVNDQYRTMLFQFRIRMEGTDLVKKGITQNQRPGNFSIQGKRLSEILTEIMFRANPVKTATGPADPLCELVWAVVDDPDQAGQKMVLVTTRTAASERSIPLPADFLPPDDSGN